MFDNPDHGEVRKYDSSIRANMQRQTVVKNNQWLRGEDGGRLFPARGGEDDAQSCGVTVKENAINVFQSTRFD